MASELPRMTVRAPQEMIDKIKEISKREHRTANEQMNYIMSKFIEEYEAKTAREQERAEVKSKLSDSKIG